MRYQVRQAQGSRKRLLFTCLTRETAELLAAGAGVPTRISQVQVPGR